MITFKTFILESLDTLKFKIDPDYNTPDTVLVEVSIPKIDKVWRLNKDYYIQKNPTHNYKYERFKEFLDTNPKFLYAPSIYITKEGEVEFDNGRHRYAVLRDLKYKTIFVSMSKESLKHAKQYKLI